MHILLKLTIVMTFFSVVVIAAFSALSYINSTRVERNKKRKDKYPYPLLKSGSKLHVVSEEEMMTRFEICQRSINSCIHPPQLETAYDMLEEFKDRYGGNSYYEILLADYTSRSVSIQWY